MDWTIRFSEEAIKQLQRMDKPQAKRVRDFLINRVMASGNPRLHGKALQGPLGDRWSYRVGDYRIICDIDDGVLTVLVLDVGNRREIYRRR